jgi:hypothetical protein
MDKIDQLEVLLAEARVEANSFYNKNNQSAGTRLRNKMQAVAVLCKEVRVEVQSLKNADK